MPNSGRTTCARSFTLILLLSGAFSFDLACATDKVDERESSEHAPPASGGANRLQHETSPYLLLHAHNPVDWYPWGPEAIARARDEDKPIFLSVGYSTCYWCHVMERKVFANDEIAAMMNEWFVNIKVDREERPDLDQIYMTATQLMSGSGGWPNSVFLTTDLKPFYAGTYFPPADSHGRPGFPRILQALHDAWLNERQKVEEVGAQLAEAIRQAQDPGQGEGDAARALPDSSLISRAVDAITMRYDGTHGGFGGAPKFPPAMRLDLLLDAPVDTVEEENKLEAIVTHTLSAMARGGMYDQIGGGFHRYSTDARWLVPHFEKMLYNQAQLTRTYTRAYVLTGQERWRVVAEDILRYVEREMTSDEGGFYSALDAETDAVEGKYYVWTEEEIVEILESKADLFLEVFGLQLVPEVERSVLYRKADDAEVAANRGMEIEQVQAAVEESKRKLLAERQKRPYPLRDDKVLTAWNGMMITAYAEAYAAFGNESYRRAAERAARFVLERLGTPSGGLQRVYRNGVVKYAGYLEDYAHFAEGSIALYRATSDRAWLEAAERIVDAMVERFWDNAGGGGFFYTEGAGADLIARSKSGSDSALPSPNAVAIQCLLDLVQETGRTDLQRKAEEGLMVFGGAMTDHPGGYTSMVRAAQSYLASEDQPPRSGPASAREQKLAPIELARLPLQPRGGGSVPEQVVVVRVEPLTAEVVSGGGLRAQVHLAIADSWHINANPPTSDWLIPTTVTMNADVPVTLDEIIYPSGQLLFFSAFEETLAVYDGQVTLTAELAVADRATAGQNGVVRFLVTFQACDDSRCLPPAEITTEMTVRVGE